MPVSKATKKESTCQMVDRFRVKPTKYNSHQTGHLDSLLNNFPPEMLDHADSSLHGNKDF